MPDLSASNWRKRFYGEDRGIENQREGTMACPRGETPRPLAFTFILGASVDPSGSAGSRRDLGIPSRFLPSGPLPWPRKTPPAPVWLNPQRSCLAGSPTVHFFSLSQNTVNSPNSSFPLPLVCAESVKEERKEDD